MRTMKSRAPARRRTARAASHFSRVKQNGKPEQKGGDGDDKKSVRKTGPLHPAFQDRLANNADWVRLSKVLHARDPKYLKGQYDDASGYTVTTYEQLNKTLDLFESNSSQTIAQLMLKNEPKDRIDWKIMELNESTESTVYVPLTKASQSKKLGRNQGKEEDREITATLNGTPTEAQIKKYSVAKEKGDTSKTYMLHGRRFIAQDESGVTIGTGLDLGSKDEKFLRKITTDEAVIKQLKPYLLLKKNKAIKAVYLNTGSVFKSLVLDEGDKGMWIPEPAVKAKANQTTIADIAALDAGKKAYYVAELRKRFAKFTGGEDFLRLPSKTQTALYSYHIHLKINAGNTTANLIGEQDFEKVAKHIATVSPKYKSRRERESGFVLEDVNAAKESLKATIDRLRSINEAPEPVYMQKLTPRDFMPALPEALPRSPTSDLIPPEQLQDNRSWLAKSWGKARDRASMTWWRLKNIFTSRRPERVGDSDKRRFRRRRD